jgi:hypothetical protein
VSSFRYMNDDERDEGRDAARTIGMSRSYIIWASPMYAHRQYTHTCVILPIRVTGDVARIITRSRGYIIWASSTSSYIDNIITFVRYIIFSRNRRVENIFWDRPKNGSDGMILDGMLLRGD